MRNDKTQTDDEGHLINQICAEFEQAWLEGAEPKLSDYDQPELKEQRSWLITRLVTLDAKHRLAHDKELNCEAYLDAFPELRDQLQPVLLKLLELSSENTVIATDTSIGSQIHSPKIIDKSTSQDFGAYELIEEIARGAMGVVFKARQKSTNRIVALKMMLSGQFANEQEIARFHSEAEAAAKLEHSNIVPIYDAGKIKGYHYLAMGFVDGKSLSEFCGNDPLPLRRVAEIIQQLAEAIDYAHSNNIVHRDLKPANVLLTKDGQPKVTDFGLAKRVEGDSAMTKTGQVIGTPSYMPPEQATGQVDKVGPLSDVYSLGAVCYELLVGRAPFRSGSVWETIAQVIAEKPVAPRSLNSAIPRDLETICLKCLEKEPNRRYSSAKALADELTRFLEDRPIHARPVPFWVRGIQWCKRKPVVASLTGLVAISLLSGAIVSSYFAVLAERRADIAEKGFRVASQQSQLALKTLQTVIYTVQERLKTVPDARVMRRELLIDVLADLQKISGGYIESANVDLDSAKVLTDLAKLYLEIGDEFGSGIQELSLKNHRRAVDIYLELVDQTPKDQDLLKSAFVSISEYGDVSREFRKFQEAVWAHQHSRELATHWAKLAPDNPKTKVARMKSSESLGEALLRSGQPELGRPFCLEAVQLAVEICQSDPTENAYDNLSRCYCTEGDMHRDLKQFDEAEASYQKMCLASLKLIEFNPENPENLSIRSTDFERLGDLEMARANYEKAREHFEESLRFSELYMADDPTNLFRMQQSTWAYQKLAGVCQQQGETDRAQWALGKLAELNLKISGGKTD